MPVFHGTLFAVDRSEMMRYAGLPPKGAAIPDALIADALREAAALAEPRGARAGRPPGGTARATATGR